MFVIFCYEEKCNHFLFAGLYENWKQPIGYFLSSSSLNSTTLEKMLSDLIKKLQDVGLTPKVVICDQGGCNRGLFKRLGISHMKTNKTYIEKDNSKIHFLWDYSHLIKSTRNMLLKYKFKVNRGILDFKYVQEVYEIEKYCIIDI